MIQAIVIIFSTLVLVPLLYQPLSSIQEELAYNLGIMYCVQASLCFIIGFITNNVSQVDKLWSISPILYVLYTIYYSYNIQYLNERTIYMAIIVTIWGIRLTYNFSRRGGYSWKFWTGEEDYRWEILRQKPLFNGILKTLRWQLFHLFFICGYQMFLILLFTTPIILSVVPKSEFTAINIADVILFSAYVFLVIFETIADNQQYKFQTQKYALINKKQSLKNTKYENGFCVSGLWKISRHPNYFAEQSIWITFYAISMIQSKQIVAWPITGCMLLLILFSESAKFSEEITAKKYPNYVLYQKSVNKFLPIFSQIDPVLLKNQKTE